MDEDVERERMNAWISSQEHIFDASGARLESACTKKEDEQKLRHRGIEKEYSLCSLI